MLSNYEQAIFDAYRPELSSIPTPYVSEEEVQQAQQNLLDAWPSLHMGYLALEFEGATFGLSFDEGRELWFKALPAPGQRRIVPGVAFEAEINQSEGLENQELQGGRSLIVYGASLGKLCLQKHRGLVIKGANISYTALDKFTRVPRYDLSDFLPPVRQLFIRDTQITTKMF